MLHFRDESTSRDVLGKNPLERLEDFRGGRGACASSRRKLTSTSPIALAPGGTPFRSSDQSCASAPADMVNVMASAIGKRMQDMVCLSKPTAVCIGLYKAPDHGDGVSRTRFLRFSSADLQKSKGRQDSLINLLVISS